MSSELLTDSGWLTNCGGSLLSSVNAFLQFAYAVFQLYHTHAAGCEEGSQPCHSAEGNFSQGLIPSVHCEVCAVCFWFFVSSISLSVSCL